MNDLKVGDYVIYNGEKSRILQIYSIRNGMYFAKTLSGRSAIGTNMHRLTKIDVSQFTELEKLLYNIG